MRVDLDANVLLRDGQEAGILQRAVIDPATDPVSHFVVSRYTLPPAWLGSAGWLCVAVCRLRMASRISICGSGRALGRARS
jgi:hypothetical protein